MSRTTFAGGGTPRTSDTGKSTPYSGDDTEELAAASARATREWDALGMGVPTKIAVTAEIEWSGSYNPRAHRSTTLDGLQLGAVLAAGRSYDDALADVGRAHRAYPAKGWYAQLRELEGTQRGRAAADAAGLDVSRRTLTGWLAQTQEPSKSNREKIAEAYGSLRSQRIGLAATRVSQAAAVIETAVTAALKNRYGAEIRLRNITDLGFMR